MTEVETAWLAGLLEGEGFFGIDNYVRSDGIIRRPVMRVALAMGDLDVVERASLLVKEGGWRGSVCLRKPSMDRRKEAGPGRDYSRWADSYYIAAHGAAAEFILRAVRPYMGARRSAKIDELLAMKGLSHHD